MNDANAQEIIAEAISTVAEANPQSTGGQWLEDLTVAVSPHVREWDIAQCFSWAQWPERETRYPGTTKQDIGVDCVAVRRSDGEHIAIQCKSRQLDEHGRGADITKAEIDSFASTSAGDFWAERWIITNGDNRPGGNALQVASMHGEPIKMVNIVNDLLQQQAAFTHEECPHCEPNPDGEERRQSKTCMQTEAIAESVRILREHEQSGSGGLPVGQARGKIILPRGTGKTRISLRIVEELTPLGELSIVLCPSIALVAQIRREYLQHAETDIRALAVCSDETAGYDPKKESSRNATADPTVDNSNVSADEVKGKVTTDPAEIAAWIRDWQGAGQVNVIFGTYQSGHRVAEALAETGVTARVLIGDEAHRTAGLRRKRNAKPGTLSQEESRIRDFTLCHDNDAFPATYRVYQTATPRIYDTSRVNRDQPSDWIVRSMDDETVFGVELYRKSYVEAVKNKWLADYRIIALGVNGPDAHDIANRLAGQTASKGRNALTTTHFLRGLAFALAMGGATQSREKDIVPIKSCIAFMNTVDKSKNMADDLQTPTVMNWLREWMRDHREGQAAAQYTLQHLDATSNVTTREAAKAELAQATEGNPHGIINVGIFGEGTDSPTLNAVAFLEARKSPIDVIQAVGRAMRKADDKEYGYIICPIVIPPNADPESWLSTSNMEEGWSELGQILLALRAHDSRIEDNLAELLHLYAPQPPPSVVSFIGIAGGEDRRIQYREHEGAPGTAQAAVERVLAGSSTLSREFRPITEPAPAPAEPPANVSALALTADGQTAGHGEGNIAGQRAQPYQVPTETEPTQIITGKKNDDGSIELRMDTVARGKPAPDGTRGPVDVRKSKDKARDMVNKGAGVRLTPGARPRRTRAEVADANALRLLELSALGDEGNVIRMNLLAKSGLVDNRVVRDLNILESSIKEAAHHLRNDGLQPALDRHFGLDNLKETDAKKQADGCTIAALLMMNAAMLHQRIANGRWLSGVNDLDTVKNATNVVRMTLRQWNTIIGHDFKPVTEPAVRAIEAVEDTGRLAGLERALRHITAEAERIAETYADMGADHAGPLFNRVMGNQASDGAFFTRPVAASIAARLTLDACGDVDWRAPEVWRDHKTVDLACGSGTLLAAMLTDMKRRAREQGASEAQIAELQKVAVEETIKGMDINPVSLQLAASQLTAGNQDIRYRQMGLHLMPYGPQTDNPAQVSVGTLELLGQKAIVPRDGQFENFADDKIASQVVWNQPDDAELEDAVEAAKDARIVIMNPPFSNRSKMGEKFPKEIQKSLRYRVDDMEGILVRNDKDMDDFVDKNTIHPPFVALADRCLRETDGILTMVTPTVALCAPSGLNERRVLAQRYHIHTVLTGRWPREFTLSQNVEIDESIIVATRNRVVKAPTRFVHLDKMPVDESDVDDLYRCLLDCPQGRIANGWGEVSYWPAEAMDEGDWTPAIWRAPELAEAAARFANHNSLQSLNAAGLSPRATGQLLRGSFERAAAGALGSFEILKSKSAEGQTRIQSQPDECWIPKGRNEEARELNGGTYPEVDTILQKAGHLLITAGQDSKTGRVTATADDKRYVGNGWMPVAGLSTTEAKAAAVFINSTAGRLQLMRHPGKKIPFPTYSAAEASSIRIPDVKNASVRQTLTDCWERTRDMTVPQFRDGECEVRRLWDEAVAEAMGWDAEELAHLRGLLHNEPHVRGLGYGQYADAVEDEPADQERFEALAERWEEETFFHSNSAIKDAHPALQEIISMGQPVVSLILERMRAQGGHWFGALQQITGARPVPPESRGRIREMTQSWLDWGERNGYI
ncbi:MAG: DEAD/DEAH box helicase family protein [Chloroflexota bacterium]|nr:DEAD/DEAH box helicase family protein [Chloroflexota bacterium]MDE2684826.1 DEAD/DEAH box helicase family protein [Chloroflexota bacterium]